MIISILFQVLLYHQRFQSFAAMIKLLFLLIGNMCFYSFNQNV